MIVRPWSTHCGFKLAFELCCFRCQKILGEAARVWRTMGLYMPISQSPAITQGTFALLSISCRHSARQIQNLPCNEHAPSALLDGIGVRGIDSADLCRN